MPFVMALSQVPISLRRTVGRSVSLSLSRSLSLYLSLTVSFVSLPALMGTVTIWLSLMLLAPYLLFRILLQTWSSLLTIDVCSRHTWSVYWTVRVFRPIRLGSREPKDGIILRVCIRNWQDKRWRRGSCWETVKSRIADMIITFEMHNTLTGAQKKFFH